jgi:hypothetical protein
MPLRSVIARKLVRNEFPVYAPSSRENVPQAFAMLRPVSRARRSSLARSSAVE